MSRNSAPTPASDSAAGAPTKVRAVTNPLTIRPLRVVVVALMIGALPLGNVRAESGSMGVITSSPKAHVAHGVQVSVGSRFQSCRHRDRHVQHFRDQGGGRSCPTLSSTRKTTALTASG